MEHIIIPNYDPEIGEDHRVNSFGVNFEEQYYVVYMKDFEGVTDSFTGTIQIPERIYRIVKFDSIKKTAELTEVTDSNLIQRLMQADERTVSELIKKLRLDNL